MTNHFVAAEQPPATIDRIRRQDVMTTVGNIVDIYTEQQRAALASVQQDIGARGYLSDASAVAERRRTSRMYLVLYGTVAGITMGGLALVAWIAGVSGTVAIAGWMFAYRDWETDRKSTRLNSSHSAKSRMPSSA